MSKVKKLTEGEGGEGGEGGGGGGGGGGGKRLPAAAASLFVACSLGNRFLVGNHFRYWYHVKVEYCTGTGEE